MMLRVLLVPLAIFCFGAASVDPLDTVVVTANGTPVLERQVQEAADVRINAQAEQERQRGLIYDESSRKDTRAYLRDDVLRTLIERILITGQLRADHLEITDADVQERLFREARDRGQTLAQAKASIAEQGQTMDSVADGLRQTMGVELLFKAHSSDQKELTEAEAREFYESNPHFFAQAETRRVSRILVRVPGDAGQSAKDAAHQKAEEVMNRVRAGEDFATLAAKYSEDGATKMHGGDRGWSPRGWNASPDADPFGNAAFAMQKVGDVSTVIRTQDGWDIIKLTGRQPASLPPFEAVKAQIQRDARYRKIGAFWEAYGGQLWKDAKVQWAPEEITRQAEKAKRDAEFARKMEAESAPAQKPSPTP